MSNFRVTEQIGTIEQINRLRDEAIGIARATGSIGATAEQCDWNNGDFITIAKVTVVRDRA